jgi:hypothetical protein
MAAVVRSVCLVGCGQCVDRRLLCFVYQTQAAESDGSICLGPAPLGYGPDPRGLLDRLGQDFRGFFDLIRPEEGKTEPEASVGDSAGSAPDSARSSALLAIATVSGGTT